MLRVLSLVVVLSVLAVPVARAQIFLELAGQVQGPILGGATFSGELNRIEVRSLGGGANVVLDPGTGTVLYRNRFNLTISKQWDSSSIKLLRAQGEEEQFTTCILRLYRTPTSITTDSGSLARMPMQYLTIELTGAFIESYNASSSGTSNASESLSFTFDAIRYTYNSTGETFYDPVRGPGSGNELARQIPKPSSSFGDGFEFVLPEEDHVGIEITDLDGRWVTTLYGDNATGSDGSVRWDATDASGGKVPAGVYTATVRTSEVEITRRMVVGD